jgi:class 3 adenylate cyclase
MLGLLTVPGGHLVIWLRLRAGAAEIFDRTIPLLLIFLGLGTVWLIQLQSMLAATIGVHSSFGNPISHAWPAIGFGVILFQLVLLEFLLADHVNPQPVLEPARWRSRIEDLWIFSIQVVGPCAVFWLTMRFLIGTVEAGVEGWADWPSVSGRLSWAAGLFIVWYFSVLSLIRRAEIRRLQQAKLLAEEILQSRYTARVDLLRAGGLTPLLSALNQAVQHLKERSRLLTGFSRFVSSQLAEKVMSTGAVKAEGQAVNCAFLMSDIEGFTGMSSRLDPTQVVQLLNIYFEHMIGIAVRHDVMIDKFIGDGILAYSLQDESGSSNQRVFDAAVEMLAAMTSVNRELNRVLLPELSIRIGLHSGSAILGSIGAADRLQYTIIGDDVNRVARLEGVAKELGIEMAVSHEFWQGLDESRRQRLKGPQSISVKGLSEKQMVYVLTV